MNTIEKIRKAEKEYHDYCYDNYQLFVEGSWLYRPVKTVVNLLQLFSNVAPLHVLDLGSGVGRNSIPIAQAIKKRGGRVDCVDLLDSAIQNLLKYSEKFDVQDMIHPIKADIGSYNISRNEYDFIVAVSSIEHVQSEIELENVLEQMVLGTKINGVNCIIVNSEIEEIDLKTNEKLPALIEINITTDEMLHKLKRAYNEWEHLEVLVKPLQYTITRNGREVILKTNAITFVARNS